MACVQDAQIPTKLNQSETSNHEVTTKTEETKTIPETEQSGIDVPVPEPAATEKPKEETEQESKEAATIDAPQAELLVIHVETKEVVIDNLKTEERPKEVIIQDPTPAEDEETKTAEGAIKVTVERTEA